MTNRNKKEKIGRPRRSPAKKNAKKGKDGHVFLSGLKNFGIIFALCLVVFGLLASAAVTLVTSAVDDIFDEKSQLEEILNKDSEPASSNTDNSDVPKGESFTALIVVTDYDLAHYNYYPQGDALSELRLHANDRDIGVLGAGYKTVGVKLISLVRCDKARAEYTVTPVSTHTRVFTPCGYKQLGEVYNDFGPQYLVDKVKALSGIGVDYFFFLNAREASELAKAIGSFEVDLSQDIYSDGATFGTAGRTYESVVTAVIPEEFLTDTDDGDDDNKDKDTGSDADTDAPGETGDEGSADGEDVKEARTAYRRVVSAGRVKVTEENLQALLMFDDYENGVESRLDLEFQLVRGVLLRIASMSSEQRLKLYDELFLDTPIIDCSVIYEEKYEQDESGESGDNDNRGKKKIHGIFDDMKVNTDMSRKSAELKSDLVGAAARFEIKPLNFEGRYANGFYNLSLTATSSMFSAYKLPPDSEKVITPRDDDAPQVPQGTQGAD